MFWVIIGYFVIGIIFAEMGLKRAKDTNVIWGRIEYLIAILIWPFLLWRIL